MRNINIPVNVKLTEEGRRHYLESYNIGLEGTQFFARTENEIHGYSKDESGYYQFSVEEFIALFKDIYKQGDLEKYIDTKSFMLGEDFEDYNLVFNSQT